MAAELAQQVATAAVVLKPCALVCCSNKDTVPVDHLDTLSPEERLTLFTNLGTLLLLAEVLVCWLFGEMDPLGESCKGVLFAAPALQLTRKQPLW